MNILTTKKKNGYFHILTYLSLLLKITTLFVLTAKRDERSIANNIAQPKNKYYRYNQINEAFTLIILEIYSCSHFFSKPF